MMQPVHVRMARAALGWSLSDLAAKSQVNLNTISRYEAGREVLSGTIDKLEKVFESAGITFIQEDDLGGPGIRMQKPSAKKVSTATKHRSK
jgi:transcriptional regulator with XRE-family HTH domain